MQNDKIILTHNERTTTLVARICRWLDRLEKSIFATLSWYSLMIAAFLIFSYGVARAQDQPTGLSLATDVHHVGQSEFVELSVHLDSTAPAYYFEAELSFDPDRLTMTDVKPGGLMDSTNGIAVGDLLDAGTAGISASRTSGEGTGPGRLIRVLFQVNANADTGSTGFSISAPILKDSQGTEISTSLPDPVQISVTPTITAGGLSEESYLIHEAQTVSVKSFAFAHGVTDVSTPSDSLRVWIGTSMTSADPTSWSDQQWKKASHLYTDAAGNSYYEATFGPALTVGDWYYAARYQLNENAYQYGGFGADTGSFWQADAAPAGQLTVEERPPYQHVLALWNFDDRDRIADQALTANRHSEIKLVGAQVEGFDDRGGGYTMATDNWHREQGADSLKYIKTRISTTDFDNIRVSSSFRATSSSARDFQLQISLDDSSWTEVPGGAIEVTEEWGSGSLIDLDLPAEVNNKAEIFLRWRRIGDIRVDGTSGISTQGKVRMDDIKITGTAINPVKPTVWPGDADNNGIVDISDVLPLGTWWGMQGPDRIVRNISWTDLQAIGWFPYEATFADTDGSGMVDQSDLEAVGMNFGRSSEQIQYDNRSQDSTLAQFTMPALNKGEQRIVAVTSDRQLTLSGFALQLDWTSAQNQSHSSPTNSSNTQSTKGKTNHSADSKSSAATSGTSPGGNETFSTGEQSMASEYFTLEPVFDATDWIYDWRQNNKLIHYERFNTNKWKGAWVHKGWTKPKRTKRLMRFKIVARKDWDQPVTYRLKSVSIARPDLPSTSVDDLYLEKGKTVNIPDEQEGAIVPKTTVLHPNHPNPFNPTTSLRYELAEPGKVSFHIYSLLGKKVATLVDGRYQQSGSYIHHWDASGMSSGVYLYILQTNNKRYSGKMLLMK